jgi:hypothetical protein
MQHFRKILFFKKIAFFNAENWTKSSKSVIIDPGRIRTALKRSTDEPDYRFLHQGCQMIDFQNKKPNLGKFFRVLQRKRLENLMAIVSILGMFGII